MSQRRVEGTNSVSALLGQSLFHETLLVLAFGAGWLCGLLCFDGLRSLRLRFFFVDFGVHFGVHRIPSADAHQHAVGVFDGVHMAIVLLDHFDRSAHLLGEDIDIDACGEAEGRIGVAEAISGLSLV